MARKKGTNVYYFGIKEEQAVIDFILSTEKEKRDMIYLKYLYKPFKKMVSSILRKYPIHIGNYDLVELESNGISHLIENMHKFRPYQIHYREIDSIEEKWLKGKIHLYFNKDERDYEYEELLLDFNSKFEYKKVDASAYSYCGTIIRNYFKDHSKKTYEDMLVNQSISTYEGNIDEDFNLSYDMDVTETDDTDVLINKTITGIETEIEENGSLRENEKIVGYAIINILKNWDALFLEFTPEGIYQKKITNKFEKNKILQLLKEQTNLPTKDIRQNMKSFKNVYNINKWLVYNSLE